MAKNVVIRDVEYNSVPSVTIPLAEGGGDAEFFDISDATIDSNSKLLSGVTAYGAGGTKYTGNIASKSSSDLTASGATVTVPAGNYSEQATKTIASGTVRSQSSITGINGTISTDTDTISIRCNVTSTPSVVTAGYISSGTSTAGIITAKASCQIQAATTYTPTTSDQTIASGTYLTGTQTISGDANLVSSNIVAGKTIFGVAGSAQIPVISQDSTTKVLSIS